MIIRDGEGGSYFEQRIDQLGWTADRIHSLAGDAFTYTHEENTQGRERRETEYAFPSIFKVVQQTTATMYV